MELDETTAARLPELAATHLGESAGVLLSRVEPSVRLRRAAPCDPRSPVSRLGGTALLGPDQSWPATGDGEPLSFLGQVNTNEISAHLSEPALPADTLLAFFYDADQQRGWGFDPGHAQYWRVTAAPIQQAVPVAAPAGTLTFSSYGLAPGLVSTVPGRWEQLIEALPSDRADALYELLDGGWETRDHRMFGWPDLVQRGMHLEVQLAANGVRVDGRSDDPRIAELAAGAGDWRLLMQLHCDWDAEWSWGDGGTLSYWIRIQDLRAGRFDRVWMILQTT